MAFKILIGPSSFAETDKTPLNRLIAAGYQVIDNPYKRKLTKNELFELLKFDVIGLVAGLEPLDREVLQRSQLRVVSRVGSGISNVDLTAALDLGIKVCSTPDGPVEAVAELTLGALLGLLRMIPLMDQALHKGEWIKKIGVQLEGKTVAVIGFGRIGRRVAELLSPFRVNLLIVDPFLADNAAGHYVKLSLADALPQADIVTIHSSGEECVIGESEFDLMKTGVFLLNVARGGVISEEALIKAIENGTVAGAWLDTFEEEPYKGPLCSYRNVILTPHVGSYTAECRSRMEGEAVENLLKALTTCKFQKKLR